MKYDTQKNQFLSLIYDLYDITRFPEKGNIVITEKKKGLFKREIIERNIELDNIKQKIELFKESLTKISPDFNRLWDFCEFVRVCEKVFFYSNMPENNLYVEMDLSKQTGVRKFRIKVPSDCTKSELRFTLEKNVLGNDIISISVVRDYGLKMNNSYKIIDGIVQYPDSSDLYLMNEINFILKDTIYYTFSSMIQLLLKE